MTYRRGENEAIKSKADFPSNIAKRKKQVDPTRKRYAALSLLYERHEHQLGALV